ncbi:MAG TPA: hypothetical protein VHU21_03090 [Paraburkholderia sp.]|nr:hypothetical protein [Paraburkholderia sp.]
MLHRHHHSRRSAHKRGRRHVGRNALSGTWLLAWALFVAISVAKLWLVAQTVGLAG